MIEYPYRSLSELWLCNVPWNETYNDVYVPLGNSFEERKAKAEIYFNQKKSEGLHYTKIQPIRNALSFKLAIKYNDAKKYNYCIYIDKDSKFAKDGEPVEMYCFFTINQINDELTEFILIPDYFIQFYIMNESRFVGRQQIARKHVVNDTIGLWREPEVFEPYRYVASNEQFLTDRNNQIFGMGNFVPVMFCTSLSDARTTAMTHMISVEGSSDGTNLNCTDVLVLYKLGQGSTLTEKFDNGSHCSVDEISDVISAFDGKASTVLNIKMFPKQLISSWIHSRYKIDTGSETIIGYKEYVGSNPTEPIYISANIDYQAFFEHDYTPLNHKCYQFPYVQAKIINNQGELQTFKLEDYKSTSKDGIGRTIEPEWICNCDVSPNGTAIAYPMGYGIGSWEFNFNYPITIGTLPTGSWVTDTYKMWLAQQGGEDTLKSINSMKNSLIDNGTAQSINQFNFQKNQIQANEDLQKSQFTNQYGLHRWENQAGQNNTGWQMAGQLAPAIGTIAGTGAFYGAGGKVKGSALMSGIQGGANLVSAYGSRQVDMTSLANEVAYSAKLSDVTDAFADTAIGYVTESGNIQKRINNEQLNATLKGAKTMSDGYIGGQSTTLGAFNGVGFFFEVDTYSKQDICRLDHYLSEWGYAVNGVMPEVNENCNPLLTHLKFNYVEFIDCTLKSVDFGLETEMRVLESIFNNGVRAFHNPEDIETRNIYQNNPPISGKYDNIIGVDT